jgi:hypothetical protein
MNAAELDSIRRKAQQYGSSGLYTSEVIALLDAAAELLALRERVTKLEEVLEQAGRANRTAQETEGGSPMVYVIIVFDSVTSEFKEVVGPFNNRWQAEDYARYTHDENVIVTKLVAPEYDEE